MRNTVLERSQAEAFKHVFEWGSVQWMANEEVGNTDHVTLGRTLIKPGCANPRHAHSKTDEVLYLLQGKITHTIGPDSVSLNAGDTICIPAGVYHNAINTGDEEADMIVAFSGERDFILETSEGEN